MSHYFRLEANSGGFYASLASYQVRPLPIERQLASPTPNVTSGILEKFSGLMRQRLRDPNPALRQDYVRLLLDEVIIADDLITMRGSKKALEPAIFGNNGARGEVPTFIRGLARHPVRSEPVSASISLIIRKIQGKPGKATESAASLTQ